jgi:magnesium chelatase subunit D
VGSWQPEETAERVRIERAQELLSEVRLDERMLRLITQLCVDFEVDGLRADIVMYKTALTLAAYAGRRVVEEADVRDAAELALLHRRRRLPFQQPQLDREQLEQKMRQHLESGVGSRESGGDEDSPDGGEKPPHNADPPGDAYPPDCRLPSPDASERVFGSSVEYRVKPIAAPSGKKLRQEYGGRRSKAQSRTYAGHYVGAEVPRDEARDLALDATLRAAAPHQRERRKAVGAGQAPPARRPAPRAGQARPLLLEPWDLRSKVRETRMGNLIVFVVDASGSMAARERMVAAKGAVLSLLLDAYQKRDQVGLVAFRGAGAELLLPPTNSIELAQACLSVLPTGGRTPLGHGLQLGLATIERYLCRRRDALPLLVLVSDGRANVPLRGGDPLDEMNQLGAELESRRVHTVFVDTEESRLGFGFAAEVAQALGAAYLPIGELAAAPLAGAVRGAAETAWRQSGRA